MKADQSSVIIQIKEVDKDKRKYLSEKNQMFKFECEVGDGQMRIGLKEINCYSPYYYEKFYTLKEFTEEKKEFSSAKTLEELKLHLHNLFKNEAAVLESVDGGEKIRIHVKVLNISVEMKDFIELDRKTIDDKDEGLLYLYDIQKKNNNLLKKIESICQDDKFKEEKVAKDIIKLLKS